MRRRIHHGADIADPDGFGLGFASALIAAIRVGYVPTLMRSS
jgi:hypothetical protein